MYAQPGRAISATFRHRQALEVMRLGVEVRVLVPHPSLPGIFGHGAEGRGGEAEFDLDGILVTRVTFPKILPYGIASRFGCVLLERVLRRHMIRIQRDFDFDVIHGIRLFPNVCSLVPVAAALERPLLGLATGSDVHTHPYRSRGIRRLTRRAIEHSDRVASVSRALAEAMLDLGRPRQPIATVYNGVDTTQFAPASEQKAALRSRLGLPSDGPGLVTVCRVVAEKGIQELAEAFAAVADAVPEAWLLIVGDGPYRRDLEAWVESRGLVSRVLVVGAKPHADIARWLNAADVFVLASYNEGLPNVILEAMACGLPVVATDVGGIGEAVVEGETGFLVPPGAPDPLAHRIELLMSDRALRDKLGSASRIRAVEAFGWRESAESLISLYEETVEAHRFRRCDPLGSAD